MTAASLSLRARLFGPATSLILKPILLLPALQMRQRLELLGKLLSRVPAGVTITPGSLGSVPMETLTPADAGSGRTILYFHGGAYLAGSPRSHRGMLATLAKAARATVIALDYRLAPEHPFPAPVDDAVAAYRALLDAGHAPQNLVLGGDSAGGNLALVTALRLRDSGLPLPARVLALSPWTDMTGSGDSYRSRPPRDRVLTVHGIAGAARQYAPQIDPRDPRVSPLFADLAGLPPLLIQVGDDEILLDDATQLATRAQAAGVDVRLEIAPKLWHVWQIYTGWMPEADAAVQRLAEFAVA